MIVGVREVMDSRESPLDPRLLRLARRFGVSRAVLYAIAVRGWQLLAGPITVVVIARFYSPELQGFYYAFASILAMQGFFELGLFNVIVNVAAHEWAHVDGDQGGDTEPRGRALARIGSLARFILRWYLGVAVLFFLVVSVAGTIFLSSAGGSHDIVWFAPWIALVACTAAHLTLLPFNSLLEGCNRVASVNGFLLVQAMLAAFAVRIVIPAGGGLWELAVS
ncbi:MAG: hypothetical protein ACSLFQ_08475, partial [Thermoanaerobaculia bacterium]